MHTAKIIRHRHKYHHYINDDLKDVSEEVEYKIIFSDPNEMYRFKLWLKEYKGSYEWDRDENKQKGELPSMKAFEHDKDFCWCDVFAYYLLHHAQYTFHGLIDPYKGEIYVKL